MHPLPGPDGPGAQLFFITPYVTPNSARILAI